MLTPDEKMWLAGDIPDTFDYSFNGTGGSGTIEPVWENEREELDYPELRLQWTVEDEQADVQSMNQLFEESWDDTSQEVVQEKGENLYSELSVRCLCSSEVDDDGVPSKIRAQAFADRLARYYRFEYDPTAPEDAGHRKILARIVSPPVYAGKQVGGSESDQYNFTVRFYYAETDVERIDPVGQVEATTSADDDDTTGADFTIDLSGEGN